MRDRVAMWSAEKIIIWFCQYLLAMYTWLEQLNIRKWVCVGICRRRRRHHNRWSQNESFLLFIQFTLSTNTNYVNYYCRALRSHDPSILMIWGGEIDQMPSWKFQITRHSRQLKPNVRTFVGNWTSWPFFHFSFSRGCSLLMLQLDSPKLEMNCQWKA